MGHSPASVAAAGSADTAVDGDDFPIDDPVGAVSSAPVDVTNKPSVSMLVRFVFLMRTRAVPGEAMGSTKASAPESEALDGGGAVADRGRHRLAILTGRHATSAANHRKDQVGMRVGLGVEKRLRLRGDDPDLRRVEPEDAPMRIPLSGCARRAARRMGLRCRCSLVDQPGEIGRQLGSQVDDVLSGQVGAQGLQHSTGTAGGCVSVGLLCVSQVLHESVCV